jgi:hypothetical protein
MSTTVEVDENGVLHLPGRLLPEARPHFRYRVERAGERLVLSPEPVGEFSERWATPESWAADFLNWANSHKDGPGLPDEAVSRDGIYD